MNLSNFFKLLISSLIFLFVNCAGGNKHGEIVDCFGHIRSNLVRLNDQPIQVYQGQVIPISRATSGTTSVILDFNIDTFPDCADKYSGILTISVHDPIPGIIFSYTPSVLPAVNSGYQTFRIFMQIPATQPNGNFSIILQAAETFSDYGYYTLNLITN